MSCEKKFVLKVRSDAVNSLKLTAPNATGFGASFLPLFRYACLYYLFIFMKTNDLPSENIIFVTPRWQRSIYKRVWKQMLLFVTLYILLTVIFHFVLGKEGKEYIPYNLPFLQGWILIFDFDAAYSRASLDIVPNTGERLIWTSHLASSQALPWDGYSRRNSIFRVPLPRSLPSWWV